MLELSLLAPEASFDEAEFWFEVSNMGGGARAQYEGRALGRMQTPVIVENYPRWAEPAGALCTRLLHAAIKQHTAVLKSASLTNFSIVIRLVPFGRCPPQELERFEVTRTSVGWAIRSTGAEWTISAGRDVRVVTVALRALIQIYWQSSRIRKVKPVEPKIYQDGKTPYIRMGELPEPAQSAFAKNIARSSRPHIAGIRDAAFAWDWTDFLEGGR